MHAIETAEHARLAEMDQLQQTMDIFKAIHDIVRNERMFVRDTDREIKDPNAFFVQKTTDNNIHAGKSVFEVEDGYFTKTIAREVG